MSSLLFLSSDDFRVQPTENGSIVCVDIMGFSLVLFYSTHCVYCQQLIPVFKDLPQIINGCQFGLINVSTNRNIVFMAKDTLTPIRCVPLLILYVNGRPYRRYQGPPTAGDIKSFIIQMANEVEQQGGFDKVSKGRDIPAYTIGIPIKGDENVCYLNYDDAY